MDVELQKCLDLLSCRSLIAWIMNDCMLCIETLYLVIFGLMLDFEEFYIYLKNIFLMCAVLYAHI